ncbi:chemotaxis protein CheW [Paraglaciecola sp. L1A13]|uniref:chemotaxis protein CheW n=1 Tax=Paraglaciecola sp. L1A13 TaxID=2686359 RepID=UPI0018EEDD65|nr:chemotaxis protein CheW [Paraglaciecola sp. L1A13]
MSRRTFGKKDVMEEYLSSLLTEDDSNFEPLEHVSKLLDSASVLLRSEADVIDAAPEQTISDDSREDKALEEPLIGSVSGLQAEAPKANLTEKVQDATDSAVDGNAQDTGIYSEPFQALIFEVAGLSLALPLTELGGIHQLAEVTPIFGKPSWFKGVMLHRDDKMNVVDTAMWVMPEKGNEKLADSAKNQYLITLDNSGWGLACERIIDTITLQPDDVKWRKFDGKRTWLSGMVKKKMCALVNVKQLIRLLDQGMNSNDN